MLSELPRAGGGFGIEGTNDINSNNDHSSVYHHPGRTVNTSARNEPQAEPEPLIPHLPSTPTLLESAAQTLHIPSPHQPPCLILVHFGPYLFLQMRTNTQTPAMALLHPHSPTLRTCPL